MPKYIILKCEHCGREKTVAKRVPLQRFCSVSCGKSEIPHHYMEDAIDAHGDSDRCLIWPFYKQHGYPSMKIDGKNVRITRLAVEYKYGPFPADRHIMHSCDNPPCFNPNHLRPGTRVDNMQDCISKGRFALGESHGMHRIDESTVRRIRELREQGNGPTAIRRILGLELSVPSISEISRGLKWKSVV